MLKPNHAFEQFSRRIKESLFRPWKGTIYRVTTLKYADPRTMHTVKEAIVMVVAGTRSDLFAQSMAAQKISLRCQNRKSPLRMPIYLIRSGNRV
jgi:hypothetical protein